MQETFTVREVINAIEQFLEYADGEFGKSQLGYFSGGGWAGRCLRFHLQELKNLVGEEDDSSS